MPLAGAHARAHVLLLLRPPRRLLLVRLVARRVLPMLERAHVVLVELLDLRGEVPRVVRDGPGQALFGDVLHLGEGRLELPLEALARAWCGG